MQGWTLGHNTDKALYDELSLCPERGRRFAGAMSGFAARVDVDPLVNAFDWANFSTVVDVGGGWGPVSIALAQRFPKPIFVVQDIEYVVLDGPAQVPHEMRDRIRFAAHDIFTTQDVEGADVYLLRHVLHNFPDDSCKEILRALVPGKRAWCDLYSAIVADVSLRGSLEAWRACHNPRRSDPRTAK